MEFHLIDMEKWNRREHYHHFIHDVRCSYSATVELDISNLDGQRLYPAMLWLLTKTVNQCPEFRTALTDQGLGIYDSMCPAYTIFNKDTKTFSAIWSEYSGHYDDFLHTYEKDVSLYSSSIQYAPKPNRPENSFDVSMVPWLHFSSFHLDIKEEGKYLLPIFTMGKSTKNGRKTLLPLAIQVHHAVCDGYHIGLFVDTLQNNINVFIRK